MGGRHTWFDRIIIGYLEQRIQLPIESCQWWQIGRDKHGESQRSTRTTTTAYAVGLQTNHEEADKTCAPLMWCRDTNVLILLVHFMADVAVEVLMISGTAKCKYYPLHRVPGTSEICTNCEGEPACWKTFQITGDVTSNERCSRASWVAIAPGNQLNSLCVML